MKIEKDIKNDVAYILLRKGNVHRTFELRPGILIDFDKKGEVVGIEILSLSKLGPKLNEIKKKIAA